MRLLEDLLNLVMPSKCAICDLSGADVCTSCLFQLQPRNIIFSRGNLEGRASFIFDESISKLLRAFKEKGQAATVRLMSDLLSEVLASSSFSSEITQDVFLVPAPSRRKNFQTRGYQPGLLLAQQLARDMNRTTGGQRFRVLNCLGFIREVQDQVGLNKLAREQNILFSMASSQNLSGKLIYVVDDTVTTGSTALECQRALSLAGGNVQGILAFAVSSSNNPTLNQK